MSLPKLGVFQLTVATPKEPT